MPDRCRSPRWPGGVGGSILGVLVLVLVGLCPAGAAGVAYGEIEIVLEAEPRGGFNHGYAEYRFQVKNRSGDRAIRVTLQMPGETGSRGGGGKPGSLGSITKTIEVAAGGVTSVSLFQPAAPPVGGDSVAVYINGRRQEQIIPMRVVAGATPPSHVMHGRRAGKSYGYPSSPKGGARNELNLLTTHRVPENFFQVPASSRFVFPPMGMGIGAPGTPPGGRMGGPPGAPPGIAVEPEEPPLPEWEAPLANAERLPGPFDLKPGEPREGVAPAPFPDGPAIGFGGFFPPPGGSRPVAPTGNVPPFEAQVQRSVLPISAWSSRWLAFTCYDGIFVTTEDLDELQRAGTESRATLQALWQYVETGGVLLVLGGSPGRMRTEVPIPAAYRHSPMQLNGLLVYSVGFGRCIVSPDRDPKEWTPLLPNDPILTSLGWTAFGTSPLSVGHCATAIAAVASRTTDRWSDVQSAVNSTSMTWRSSRSFVDLNKNFPVVDDLGLPVKGLFALMVLFGVAMGPANLMWLTRTKRRIWLLWTVPALSLFFCFAVLGYMVVAEGWQGHARVGGITILDEGEKRATTLGRTAFYSPVTPGDGLHFGDTTEVQMLGDENAAWTSSCSIDWTNDQHLARGWVTARVPAFFALRKSETLRRERITLHREADGGLSVANALGVDIAHLWLADEKGRLYRAAAIAAGGNARLESEGKLVAPTIPLHAWREIYSNTDWLAMGKTLRDEPARFLGPGTYVAFVESSPFLEQGLKNAHVRPTESVILGVMADPAGKR
jgi:hypothetical protein